MQVRDLIAVQQRRAVRAHFAKAAVLRTEPARDSVFLQNRRNRASQTVARQVLYPAISALQRGQSLLIALAVANKVQRNQHVVQCVAQRVRARNIQRVSVVND